MGLRLNTVPPRQGWRWITQAFAVWRRRPLALVGLFAGFMLGELLLMGLVPVVGAVAGLAAVPLLSLGFMLATGHALRDGPVHVGLFADGLRHPDKRQRLAQWQLCGAYAVGSLLVIWLSDLSDGGSLEAWFKAMSEAKPGQANPEVDAALANPQLALGLAVRLGLAGVLSVPFWHASALVHWGGQGALQALFSSTLSVWRCRGAFLVYALGWAGVMVGVALLAMLLVALLGAPRLVGMLAMPIALVVSAVFYCSLWFSFADSFGAAARGDEPAA